ncbi:MAG: hypothetical protein PHV35_00380 [Mariniphaga sp.]|nr:hypothetical protein [Mariniphaga sp.]
MKQKPILLLILFLSINCMGWSQLTWLKWDTETLGYHAIQVNPADHTIIPWYNENPGRSYDFVINKIWDFWAGMRTDQNGLPYYMNHQVWRPGYNDRRGIGGDQLAMALSSWQLYYNYSGNEQVKENMKFIADYYLSHALSPADAEWPNIPYPYNCLIYSGIYDGDMVIGKHYTQPDKAGSFGFELTKLYKMTGSQVYLDYAVNIANTLAAHTKKGDNDNSPMPFKVNAITGETGKLKSNRGDRSDAGLSSYTTNYSGTLELFLNLEKLNAGNVQAYKKAFDTILFWMKQYPLKTNKWGPFFEDIPGWSDTQINAVTFAQFMMNNPEYFPEWKKEVAGIFDWVYETVGNKEWQEFGVTVINEQTVYQTPGNSHTSRQASAELQYAALTGDTTRVKNAILQLNWATYMVNSDGRNCYPRDEVWLTDGFGDYVRHYIRAMAHHPEIAPETENHILSSTSILQMASYPPEINKILSGDVPEKWVDQTLLFYKTFDNKSSEVIRLTQKPSAVLLWLKEIPEGKHGADYWNWQPMKQGGLLTIHHTSGNHVVILK